jgi:hypothetical protein
MANWPDIQQESAAVWQRLRRAAGDRMGLDLADNAESKRGLVEEYLAMLDAWRKDLDLLDELVKQPEATDADRAKSKAMDAHYHDMAAGLFADAHPVDPDKDDGFGIAPSVVIVVGAVGLTAVGLAWAVVTHQYVKAGREETELAVTELTARIELSRAGKKLQDSTLPPPPNEGVSFNTIVGGVVAVGVVTGLGIAVWKAVTS